MQSRTREGKALDNDVHWRGTHGSPFANILCSPPSTARVQKVCSLHNWGRSAEKKCCNAQHATLICTTAAEHIGAVHVGGEVDRGKRCKMDPKRWLPPKANQE
jgi:hypothetical protein